MGEKVGFRVKAWAEGKALSPKKGEAAKFIAWAILLPQQSKREEGKELMI